MLKENQKSNYYLECLIALSNINRDAKTSICNANTQLLNNSKKIIVYHHRSYKSKYINLINRNKLINNNPWISLYYKNC